MWWVHLQIQKKTYPQKPLRFRRCQFPPNFFGMRTVTQPTTTLPSESSCANCNDLYRGPEYGLIVVRPGIRHIEIMKGADLFPIVVDRVRVKVIKDGKNKGSKIPSAHLNAMLKAEAFLGQFQAVDLVTKTPMYLPDYHAYQARLQRRWPRQPHHLRWRRGEQQRFDGDDQ